MENDNLARTPEDKDELTQTTDLDNMQRTVGTNPTDLSDGLADETPSMDEFPVTTLERSEDEIAYKKTLEDEANAVVGSE